jgi:hypothetical protein
MAIFITQVDQVVTSKVALGAGAQRILALRDDRFPA